MSLKSWLQEIFASRGDGLTCPERMLKLMASGEWVSTETLYDHLKDYRDAKSKLKKQGYLFERKYEGKNAGKQKRGTNYKTYYRLIGQIPAMIAPRGKRGYIEDFDTESLISELWKRDILFSININDTIYNVLNYDNNNKPAPCIPCNSRCCENDKEKV